MLIFDSHAHIISPLAGACGYSSSEEHLAVCQAAMRDHLSQPSRLVDDNSIVNEKKLWNLKDRSIKGRLDTSFRVGDFGRFQWNQDGRQCYIQYLPPYATDMSCPPGMLKAMMDYAGVNKAVLQCGGVYGRLNGYYAQIMKDNPRFREVFYPLASVNPVEDPVGAGAEVERAVKDDGLAGIWIFPEQGLFDFHCRDFWDRAAALGVPVFLAFFPDLDWTKRILAMSHWINEYPELPIVLPQAFPLPAGEVPIVDFPSSVERLLMKGNIFVEIIYPISQGNREAYPFNRSLKAFREVYSRLGAEKLVWGSDIPMVERYCTYAQSLNYLGNYSNFLSEMDLEKILGKNLEEIFKRKQ
ncbi:MAG: amidohydrolase [Spirochaetales bacterium]|nr:amidohydrolase [Spirochaetales bacterium]